jgi:hypothetical protein
MNALSDIARTAVPFGLPTVDLHRILVNFALDPTSPEFKAPLNEVHHTRGLADPSDLSVVAMNVDTPYSWAWLDLRGGPVLLRMPAHETDRYMSAQIDDLYTNIVGYVTPRTSGSAGGLFLVRGPAGGEVPPGVDGVFECPTDLAIVLVRTQLFDDADLPNVAALQDQVEVTPLGEAPPLPATVASVDVRSPLGPDFLRSLDWMLQFMPRLGEDDEIRTELTGLGVGVGLLEGVLAEPAAESAVVDGLALGMQDVLARCATVRSSAELFGSREFYAGDYLVRAAGAYLGILGNAAEEYLGVGYRADADGLPFDGASAYTITFAADGLPPVAAFWSITVYDADGHLCANRLNRYVLGSRQLTGMPRADDGSLTLHVQHGDVPAGLEPTWLPCPAGPFGLTFRTYLPGEAIRSGEWTAPPVLRRSPEPPGAVA